jgi:hypothetical protein
MCHTFTVHVPCFHAENIQVLSAYLQTCMHIFHLVALQEASLRLQWASWRGSFGDDSALMFTSIPADHFTGSDTSYQPPTNTSPGNLANTCCYAPSDAGCLMRPPAPAPPSPPPPPPTTCGQVGPFALLRHIYLSSLHSR